jgi:peroxiredoxin
MKNLLFTFLILTSTSTFAQSRFTISGKTNIFTNGKVILSKLNIGEFSNASNDTAILRNQTFKFQGELRFPQQYRIILFDHNGKQTLTEPIFIGSGNYQINIDSSSSAHDFLDVGYGVSLEGSKENNEYINKYLTSYSESNKRVEKFFESRRKCSSIADTAEKRSCLLIAENEKLSIRKSRDSILFSYVKLNPSSKIAPWILYEAILRYGYSEFYQASLTQIIPYIPNKMYVAIRNLLNKQKLKTPNRLFPLIDFVKTNITTDFSKAKYTLVEFWYSGCSPCIAQFNELKEVYKKFHEKGFEIVAISVDTRDKLPALERIIKKNSYPWQQIFDVGGTKAQSIDVNSFPSSFLLNSQGKIIKTNVSTAVLSEFLIEKAL